MSKPYTPKARVITRSQAMLIARQYSSRVTLMIYSYTGEIEDERHRRQIVSLLADMFDNVKRGPGHCLHRSQIKNLAHHVMFQKVAQSAKQRKAAYV